MIGYLSTETDPPVISRLFKTDKEIPDGLSDRVQLGHLYVALYYRGSKYLPNAPFHWMLVNLNTTDPLTIRKHHAMNVIDSETKKEKWKYDKGVDVIPNHRLVALVRICTSTFVFSIFPRSFF